MHLDHITIRTHELEATRNFMVSVFDLVEGPRPAAIIASIAGYWLYDQGTPLVHLIQSHFPKTDTHANVAEAIDHFAFVMENYNAFKEKLIRMQIPFELMHLPELNRKRIFLRTPSNLLIETIFESR
jgi:glyoxylase I family protein